MTQGVAQWPGNGKARGVRVDGKHIRAALVTSWEDA